jgi:TP901 family phage tail tape measure protein
MESIFQLGILLRVMDMVSGPVQTIARNIDTLTAKAEKLQPVFAKFRDYGTWIAGAGVAGALGLGVAVHQFANLEEAQLGLRTLLMDSTGRVGGEYQKLNALAEKLGTDLPGSTKDMLEMFTALREQGVQTNVILGGMGEAAAKFAVLMKVPFAQAATHVAKFCEALGIADKDAVQFMDILQRLKGAGGVSVTDMAESLKYMGASLKALKIQGLDAGRDVSAAIGLMATSSLDGSQAGTNFAMALSRMAEISHRLDSGKIKSLVGPILDAKGIKLNFFDDAGNFVGIRNMIGELEKLRAVNPQEQLVVLSKLFGQEAARPLSVFINQGLAGFDAMTLKMKNQADMNTKINEIMSGTKMQWETLTGTISNVVAHIGGVVSKSAGLVAIMKLVNDMAGKLDTWIVANPQTAGIIAGVAIALTVVTLAAGGLLLAIGLIGALVTKAIVGFGLLVQGLALVKMAIMGVSTAMLTNPVTWIIVGIVALTVALIWLYNRFEGVRTSIQFVNFFLGFLLGNIVKVGMGFYQALAHPLLFIQSLWWGVGQILGRINLFASGAKIIQTLVAGIKSVAMAPVEAVKGIFTKLRNLLPFSDAKEGPLSQLTLSGSRIMSTLAEGAMGAAPELHQTMAAALAGAALATSVAVNPVPALANMPAMPPGMTAQQAEPILPPALAAMPEQPPLAMPQFGPALPPALATLPAPPPLSIQGSPALPPAPPFPVPPDVITALPGPSPPQMVMPSITLPQVTPVLTPSLASLPVPPPLSIQGPPALPPTPPFPVLPDVITALPGPAPSQMVMPPITLPQVTPVLTPAVAALPAPAAPVQVSPLLASPLTVPPLAPHAMALPPAVQPPVNQVAARPAAAATDPNNGGRKVTIQSLTVQISSVADANDFVSQLQTLVEGYDV